MSRTVSIAPEVVEQIGAEQAARMTGPQWTDRVQCWECGRWIEPTEDVAVGIMRVTEIEESVRTGTGGAAFGIHSHPACLPSQVLVLTMEELEAREAEFGDDEPDHEPQVDVVATVFESGQGDTGYPVVLVSYRTDLIVDGTGPDRVDLLTSALIGRGWHPITTLAAPPGPGPAGYKVKFVHTDLAAGAPGVLSVIDPAGNVETTAHVTPTRLWRPGVARTGRTVLIQGSRYLTDWATRGRAGVKAALRAGLLVGGVVEVDLDGPGDQGPGSVYR